MSVEIILRKSNDWKRSMETFEVRGDVEVWAENMQPPEAAWCQISVWDGAPRRGTPRPEVSCTGGSVTPSAWPSLFLPGQPPRIELTEAGKAAFAAARAAGVRP